MTDRGKDLEGGSYEEEEGLEWEAELAADEGARASASRKGILQEKAATVVAAEGAAEGEAAGGKRAASMAHTFTGELRAQLEKHEQLVREFQFQLEITRTRHSLATGGKLEDGEAGPAASMPSSAGFVPCPSQPGPCGGGTGAPGWEPAALSLQSQPGAPGMMR